MFEVLMQQLWKITVQQEQMHASIRHDAEQKCNLYLKVNTMKRWS
jgi:hypothetical protein